MPLRVRAGLARWLAGGGLAVFGGAQPAVADIAMTLQAAGQPADRAAPASQPVDTHAALPHSTATTAPESSTMHPHPAPALTNAAIRGVRYWYAYGFSRRRATR